MAMLFIKWWISGEIGYTEKLGIRGQMKLFAENAKPLTNNLVESINIESEALVGEIIMGLIFLTLLGLIIAVILSMYISSLILSELGGDPKEIAYIVNC